MLLHDTLDYHARENPAAEFASQGSRRICYAEAQRLANRMAHALVARGLAPGDRIGILSKNSIEHALWYYACSKCGVVPVPLNYRLAPPEWSYIANDAGLKLLFAQDTLAQAIAPVRGELTSVKHWVARIGRIRGVLAAENCRYGKLSATTAIQPERGGREAPNGRGFKRPRGPAQGCPAGWRAHESARAALRALSAALG